MEIFFCILLYQWGGGGDEAIIQMEKYFLLTKGIFSCENT